MKLKFKPIPYTVVIDEEEVKEIVRDAFTEEFGEGFVKDIYIGKFPSNYELVVYLENENDIDAIFHLYHQLSDYFYAHGLPIAISTRKYTLNRKKACLEPAKGR